MSPKLYRAIVIDPAARTIEEVQSTASYEEMHQLVGALVLDHFRLADHGDSWDYGWCDDQGLAREKAVHAFLFSIRTDPIAGRCAIFGVSKEGGDTCDARFLIDVLRQAVTWLGLIQPKVDWIKTSTGERAVVTFKAIS